MQKADLLYLSGTVQQCHLALPAEGAPRLLVRKVRETAEAGFPLRDVVPLRSFRELPGHVRDLCGGPPWRIGMELGVLPVVPLGLWRTYRGVFGDDAEIVDCAPQLITVRSRKSAWELDRFRDAARIHPAAVRRPSGVGLEVNELPVIGPRSDRPLEAGNVIALEPKYTDREYGVIGIENTYVVTEDGAEKLTTATEAVVEG